ncbi:MAG: YqgE/AlgH family protein [Acidimicrobiia bacterium]|nr:YqgE/AlgH family protein [Acidimicrobiia bacterium]
MNWRGSLLVATPRLADPRFVGTVLLICEHSRDGALGLVLNRSSDLGVDEALPEWVDVVTAPPVVFIGGPVQPEIAIALADAAHAPEPLESLDAGLAVLDDLEGIPQRLRIYSGYAGWGPGQLEDEVEERSWWVIEAQPEDLFSDAPADLRRTVLRRQRDDSALFAFYPPLPGLN